MPLQKHRTRSLRRVKVRLPSGRLVIHYEKRKPKRARCGICKRILPGVVRALPYKIKNLSKSKRIPSRPFAGNLCSACQRKKILEKFRTGDLK